MGHNVKYINRSRSVMFSFSEIPGEQTLVSEIAQMEQRKLASTVVNVTSE